MAERNLLSGGIAAPEGAYSLLQQPGGEEALKWLSAIDPTSQLAQTINNGGTITAVVSVSGVPQLIKNASYTLTLDDADYHLYKSNTNAYTWTIPANSAVAFPIGTCVSFVNGGSAGNITIAITTDTLRLAGTTGTGSRTLGAYGMATAIKVASTVWIINGTGLT